jgi:predicted branched-subunit amino acid permease
VLGALAGSSALDRFPSVAAGLGFMLPALFLALLMSILSRAQLPVILAAGLATVGLTLAVSATAGILGGMIAGALAGLVVAPGRGTEAADAG